MGAPPDDLPTGALFWRAQTAAAGSTGYESSPSWGVRVRSWSTDVQTAWPEATDLNMDGLGDVAVAACGADACTSSVFIHYATTDGVSSMPDTEVAEPAGSAGGFGYAVANGGDTRGDGYADLLVGSKGADAFFMHANTSTGLSPGPSETWSLPPGDHILASAGDVNRDGYADIVVVADGAPQLHLGLGSTWSVTDLSPIALPFDGVGASDVDCAGDVNGDGHSDVIVGVAGASSAALYLGGPDGLDPVTVTTLVGSGDFGASVAGVGDVNGDGYTDVAVGAPGTGEAHVFLGGPEG
ncbi:MAG: FG-GAP-like repeat-containing protein, partial [Myxococcota bacterium]|nr:FG-GAP-like repeat-containing protein [Myxococcota bacterium]